MEVPTAIERLTDFTMLRMQHPHVVAQARKLLPSLGMEGTIAAVKAIHDISTHTLISQARIESGLRYLGETWRDTGKLPGTSQRSVPKVLNPDDKAERSMAYQWCQDNIPGFRDMIGKAVAVLGDEIENWRVIDAAMRELLARQQAG